MPFWLRIAILVIIGGAFAVAMVAIPSLWIIQLAVKRHQNQRRLCAEWITTIHHQFERLTDEEWRQHSWPHGNHAEIWWMMYVLMAEYAGGTFRNFISHDNWLTEREHSFEWLNSEDGSITIARRSRVENNAFHIVQSMNLSDEVVADCRRWLTDAGRDVDELVEHYGLLRKATF